MTHARSGSQPLHLIAQVFRGRQRMPDALQRQEDWQVAVTIHGYDPAAGKLVGTIEAVSGGWGRRRWKGATPACCGCTGDNGGCERCVMRS